MPGVASSACMHGNCVSTTAMSKAVWPLLLVALTLIPGVASSACMYGRPLNTASCKGVRPSLSVALTLIPGVASSACMHGNCSASRARNKGV